MIWEFYSNPDLEHVVSAVIRLPVLWVASVCEEAKINHHLVMLHVGSDPNIIDARLEQEETLSSSDASTYVWAELASQKDKQKFALLPTAPVETK